MKIYTIGFTKKSAETFFGLLSRSGAARVVDVRLNNVSQLAGFAKRDDLRYFLQTICAMGYVHEPLLAPTKELLDRFKKHKGSWAEYEEDFLALMRQRDVANAVSREVMGDGVLLCSEHEPEHCHRRLVAQYLRDAWGDVSITHLT